MQSFARHFSVLAMMSCAAFGDTSAKSEPISVASPITKVLELLEAMKIKGKADLHKEAKEFSSYSQFCEDEIGIKTKSVEDDTAMINRLTAEIGKLDADMDQLGNEIAGHQADIATWADDLAKATRVRNRENADYQALYDDYTESIDALKQAIETLKQQDFDRRQLAKQSRLSSRREVTGFRQVNTSLLQVANLVTISEESRKVISNYLSQRSAEELVEGQPGYGAAGAPEANAYEFQSGAIISMCEKLLDKFEVELTEIETKERNTAQAYGLLKDDLEGQTHSATEASRDKTEDKMKKSQIRAAKNGELTDTTKRKNEDTKYLNDLKAEYASKKTDMEARTALRNEEIETIVKVIELMQKTEVSNSDSKLPVLLQKKSALSQLRANSNRELTRARLVQFLKDQSSHLNSRVLELLAMHAASDPFVQVKKMVRDLIVRLLADATAESEHKGWCDSEVSSNEQTRREMTAGVETLHAEIDELISNIGTLTNQISKLNQELSELIAAMAQADKFRMAEKADNTATIEDAVAAQGAVGQALTMLKEFYTRAGESTQFLQTGQPSESFVKQTTAFDDGAYKGMQGQNTGVVGMLTVVQSDFARLESDTTLAEQAAQKAYQEYMNDSNTDRGRKEAEIEHKTQVKTDTEKTLSEKKDDLLQTQEQLDKALAYYEKLKPSCIDSSVAYHERTERRKSEIQSLQDALRIMEGDEVDIYDPKNAQKYDARNAQTVQKLTAR